MSVEGKETGTLLAMASTVDIGSKAQALSFTDALPGVSRHGVKEHYLNFQVDAFAPHLLMELATPRWTSSLRRPLAEGECSCLALYAFLSCSFLAQVPDHSSAGGSATSM